MKIARLDAGKVAEIIPEYALPVEKWYGKDFAALCEEVPDYVEPNWAKNERGEWEQPKVDVVPPPPEPTPEDRIAALEDAICEHDAATSQRLADIEMALCEMDSVAKGGV